MTFKELQQVAKSAESRKYATAQLYDPNWGRIWREVRLRCHLCDGYLVYWKTKKFAFCHTSCGFTVSGPIYRDAKKAIVYDLCNGIERIDEQWPYFRTEVTTRRVERKRETHG